MRQNFTKTKLNLLIIGVIFIAKTAAAQTLVDITVSSNVFTPSSITICAGDTIRWTNIGGIHNVNGTLATYPSNPESFGNAVAAGWVYTYVFNTPGFYNYQCNPHVGFGMIGNITVNSDDASFNYSALSYCVNDTDPTPNITGLTGGTFSSSPAGLSINATTGIIDVSTSIVGSYTVTYSTAGACPNASNVTVAITTLYDASFNYSASSYCMNDSDPTPTITGLTGGAFSSSPAGLSINAITGIIDVSTSTGGTYTVTYSIAGACPNSSDVTVAISTLDDASFNYGASSYCMNDSDPTPTITGLTGGAFSSSPTGLSINAITGIIDVSTSTDGTYTVTYSTAGACPNSSNASIVISTVDTSVTNNSPILTSNATGANYQWLDCSGMTPISGATNQSYTAITDGDYAVIVTNNGCSDTSVCYSVTGVGIMENDFGKELLIFSNPTDGYFSIDLGSNYESVTITVTTINGKVIQSNTYIESQLLNLKLEESSGIYLLVVESRDKKAVIRLIKK